MKEAKKQTLIYFFDHYPPGQEVERLVHDFRSRPNTGIFHFLALSVMAYSSCYSCLLIYLKRCVCCTVVFDTPKWTQPTNAANFSGDSIFDQVRLVKLYIYAVNIYDSQCTDGEVPPSRGFLCMLLCNQ